MYPPCFADTSWPAKNPIRLQIRLRVPRLIWVFAVCTSDFVGFVVPMTTENLKSAASAVFRFSSLHAFYDIFRLQAMLFFYYLSPVFEHYVMTNLNCACPAVQRGQGSVFLSEGSSGLTACMSEQRRFWRDCADAQARLNLRCSHRWLVPNSLDAVHFTPRSQETCYHFVTWIYSWNRIIIRNGRW